VSFMRPTQPLRAYLMAGARHYHIASDTWVEDGKARCGADISHPGWAAERIGEPMSYRCAGESRMRRATLCAHCAKRACVEVRT
jgi:hypothetical protein